MNSMMKRMYQLILSAIVVCGAVVFTSCSKVDNNNGEDLTTAMLTGLWVSDYAEIDAEGDLIWTRVVEDYLFNADGTGLQIVH